MLAQFHNRRFYFVLAADLALFVAAFVGAFLLRFDFTLALGYYGLIVRLFPVLIPSKILIFFLFGLYRGMWRYTGLNDLWRLVQASFWGMLVYIAATLFIHGFRGVPRSVFLVDAMLTFLMCGGLRMGIRIIYATWHSETTLSSLFFSGNNGHLPGKTVLIIGAGGAGEKMLREIFDNPHIDYQVVGFLDDDPNKWGRSLHGLKVFGSAEMLPQIIQHKKIDEVLIATPAATGAQMRRIIEICKNCEARYRTLPEIGSIINGKVSIKNLRDVRYEDLLRRAPVTLDRTKVSQYLTGKRVLITGAGGSIGSELCRQIIRFDPKELILLDVSEANLYGLQMELHHELNFHHYQSVLARVQDKSLMAEVFRGYRPQLILHAAAYKHVPMLEQNPWEAIYNNVLGSQVVMDLAAQYGAERLVLVSTDKAVRPTNVMGASKRLSELILQARQGNGTRFMAVRFGNVIGSSGSVLPLFRRQLEQGGPITVTHPEVTRYFMTIPEAAQLILQAGELGEGGEIFILEMGTPVKIARMAEELVRLSGKIPGKDVDIIFTGLRAGEKLYEELITQDEGVLSTKYEKIMVIRSNGWNGRKNQAEFSHWLNGALEDLYRISGTYDVHGITGKLREILPEYVPQQHRKSRQEIKRFQDHAATPSKASGSQPDSEAAGDAPFLAHIQIPTRQPLKVS
jgi:FlaA1/EpsC-like NDP-sugar epimerase